MPFPQRPRTVITGAGSGLGRACALQLARRHGRILVAEVNIPAADETVRLVQAAGGEGVSFPCDVTKPEDLERAAAEMDRRWGGTDILVNNAGVAAAGQVGEQSLDDWRWIVGINLWGVIHGCHVFTPRFRAAQSGFILNVASAAGFVSMPEMASYNVTKAGVIALSETMYGELGACGVHVSVACPSFFQTNLMDTFRSSQERQRAIAQNLFRRSRVSADEIAAAGLAALEAGTLYVVPQTDAKVTWWLKRLSPAFYFGSIRKRFYSKLVERQLLK
jgi:NAD(P)-dependent dehydrogenase (short-subunit alcohol dehydrogenase family)